MKTFFASTAAFLLSALGVVELSPSAKYMAQARAMINEARECKAAGYHCAARAAVQAAQDYRRAAHAARFYAKLI